MFIASLGVCQSTTNSTDSNAICKCIPGDRCWPSAKTWADFNTTIGGKLVTPTQLAVVCHNPSYDEAACAYIQEQWTSPFLQFVLAPYILRVILTNTCSDDSSSSIMAASVANESCDPFTVRELPCEAGDSVTYSVNATDARDFVQAIAFANRNNIRLVVRNTGHE